LAERGCGGGTEPSAGLSGNYDWLDTVSPSYVGLSLQESGGSVTGTGLSSVLFGPVVVTGTYTPPGLLLTIVGQ